MTRKKKRGNPLRIAVLVVLVGAALYVNQFIIPSTPPLFIPTPTPTRSPTSYLNDAVNFVSQGKYIQAVASYEQAIQSDPRNINTYLDLARLEVLYGDFDKALENAENALLLNNNQSMAHAIKGWAMGRKGDYLGGLGEIQNAIQIDPGNAAAYAYMAELLANQQTAGKGDLTTIDKATAASRKALDLAPNQMESHRARGLVLEMTGNYQEAITEFNEAIKLNDNLADLHLALGRNYKAVDPPDYNKAVDEFNRAIALKPTDPQPYVENALTYLKIGEYAKAAQYASQAIQQNPIDPLLYGYLGTVYFRQQAYGDAVEPLRLATRGGAATTSDNKTVEVKGLSLSSDTSAIYARYGLSLAHTNACGEALQIAQTLNQAFPSDETVAYNAGAIIDTCKGGGTATPEVAGTPGKSSTPSSKATPKP